jgi:hypothetical protein
VFGKTRSPGDAVRTALAQRTAARRAVGRRGLYLVDLRLAILRLRRAGSALRATAPAATSTATDLANVGYLGRAVELETALLESIRDSRITRAESVYHDLVAHHRTQDATASAVASLPADVRTATAAEPVAFGLPVSLLGGYLRPAMPPLLPCRHGHLGAAGGCLTPPCPALDPEPAAGA